MSFQSFMHEVDAELESICGLSANDLSDVCYRDMYDSGCDPQDAAVECLEQSDFPMDLL